MASEVIPKYPPLHAPYCRGGSCHAAGGQPRSCGPHAARSRAHGVARRRSPAAPLWTSILQRFCTCKIGYRSYDEAFRPFSSIILFVLLCYFEPSEVILSLSLSLSVTRRICVRYHNRVKSMFAIHMRRTCFSLPDSSI